MFDNCAHVIDAAASVVSAILRGAPHIRILATSREPLRTEGEHLCRLEPLETPPPSHDIRAAEALRYSSVQLFVEQAAATLDGFQLTDSNAPLVCEICRKLDGIPLAIELAAARVHVVGLGKLAMQLNDQMRLLTDGRRTAVPRHRTMRAALDWSYNLLSQPEQIIFNRLAVFVGGFTLSAATTVAADESQPGDEVLELVLDLATKSLVIVDTRSPSSRFGLLDTTRAYALEKLREKNELGPFSRRHAEFFLNLLEAAENDDTGATEVYAGLEFRPGQHTCSPDLGVRTEGRSESWRKSGRRFSAPLVFAVFAERSSDLGGEGGSRARQCRSARQSARDGVADGSWDLASNGQCGHIRGSGSLEQGPDAR